MSRRGILAASILALILAPACARSLPAPPPAEVPGPPPEAEVEPAPSPAERSLEAALQAMDQGRLEKATRRLEQVPGMEGGAEVRGEALYTLAVLLARPDHPGRDVARAAGLLEEFLAADPPPAREAGARLILGLLDVEGRYRRQVQELRGRAAVSGAEAEDLRLALARKEAELKRIKEILLGRSGGL